MHNEGEPNSAGPAAGPIGDGAGNANNKGIRGRTPLLPPLLRPQKPPPPAQIGFATQSTGKKCKEKTQTNSGTPKDHTAFSL